MMPAECKRWSVLPDKVYRRVINVKTAFDSIYPDFAKQGMAGMLKTCGLTLDGRHHSGIDDSKNIAKIVQHLTDQGFVWSDDKVLTVPAKDYEIKKARKAAGVNKGKVLERLEDRRLEDRRLEMRRLKKLETDTK